MFVTKNEKNIFYIEIIVLGLLVLNVFRSCYYISFTADEMYRITDSGSVHIDNIDDIEYMLSENNDGDTIFKYDFGKLHSGAYDITIEYLSDYYWGNDLKNEQEKENKKTCGMVYIADEKIDTAVKFSNLALRDGQSKSKSTFWVEPFYRIRNIKGEISFYGQGRLGIKQVSIAEKRSYRIAYILAYITVILFINFVYLVATNRLLVKRKRAIYSLIGIVTLSLIPIHYKSIYLSDDIHFHINRLVSLADAFNNLQIPNRINQDAFYGYSYITPIFYGEILLVIPALLINSGVPVSGAVALYNIMINIGTIVIFFYVSSKIFDNDYIALIGTAAYTLAPYRMQDMYSRMALGEYSAWMFLPLIVYGFWYIYNSDAHELKLVRCWPVVLGLTGIIQTHVLSGEMSQLFIVIICFVLWKKTFNKKRFWILFNTAVLTILINLWFIYPFIDSMSMKLNVFNAEADLIQQRGLDIADILSLNLSPGARFILGEYFLAGIIIFAYIIVKNKRIEACHEVKIYKFIKLNFAFSIFSAVLSLNIFPYDRIASMSQRLRNIICMIQFPWRFLMFISLFASFVICGVIYIYKINNNKEIMHRVEIVFFVMIVVSYLISVSQYDNYMIIYTSNERDAESYGGNEYLLKDTDISNIEDTKIVAPMVEVAEQFYEKGIYRYNIVNKNKDGEAEILFPIFDYDNYAVYDCNGNEILHTTGKNNRIQISVPANYSGFVEVRYEPPKEWRMAELISLVTIISYAGYVLWDKFNQNKIGYAGDTNEGT